MAGTFSIGTGDKGYVVLTMCAGDDCPTVHTMVSPSMARVYGAMLMALADQIDPPEPLTREPRS